LSLVIHTHLREDALALYGFKTAAERESFLQLQTVKSIGPKMALMILAAFTPADIANAVRRNNPLALVVPGIGPKTAERIVQELRDALAPREVATGEPPVPPLEGAAAEAVSALENMGCEPKLAARAVREVIESNAQLAASSSRVSRAQPREAPARDPLVSFESLMKGALQWLREKKR
jgi:Holliday junction DNA helicase RuvA